MKSFVMNYNRKRVLSAALVISIILVSILYREDIFRRNVNTKEEMRNAAFRLNALRLNVSKEILEMKHSQVLEAYLKDGGSLADTKQKVSKEKQIILLTAWRSGSTFMNDLLGSHPGTYKFYEPLLPYGVKEYYDENSLIMDDGVNVQDLIHDLLNCKYSSKYVKQLFGKEELVVRNSMLFAFCKSESSSFTPFCYQKTFLETACSIFPWIIMKVVRLGLKFLKPVLEDESLNPYVIYLVRDPRPVIHSRISTVKWCRGKCRDALSLCNHMEDNLKHFKEFATKYPSRVHLIRYEDISLSTLNATKELFEKIDFDFNAKIEKYISSHTTTDIDGAHSTKRESSKHVLKWTSKIDSATLDRVQKTCTKVMEQMGYLPITSTNNITISDVLGPLNL